MTLLLFAALLTSPFQAVDPARELPRIILDAHRSNVGVPMGHPDLYDALMICTPLGPALGRPREDFGNLAVQRVRVEDSRAFTPGTVVEVFFDTTGGSIGPDPKLGEPVDPATAPPVGARVLLVARAARKGVLRIPWLGDWEGRDFKSVTLGAGAPPTVYGEAFFLTSRTRLAGRSDPKERYAASVAEAIPRTGDANAVRLADFMRSFAGPRGRDPYGRPEDHLSRIVSEAVSNDTPYHRALVDHVLNSMGYWGFGDRFYIDMRASAADPNAFPNGVPPLEFWEDVGTGSNPALPKNFKHTSGTTWEEHRAILRRAKSPAVSVWLLQSMPKPPEADLRAMARFLDSPDPRLRHAFVERLAAWNGEPAPEAPRQALGEDGRERTEYPGLDATVARWKARLKAR